MIKKPEFSKLVLGAAVLTWFAGAVYGAVIVNEEHAQLGELLAYIGAPAATAFGFYYWKAKAENVVKISQAVEKDKKIPESTKKQLITNIAKAINEIETETGEF